MSKSFAEMQEKYKELYETNKKMTEWMSENLDNIFLINYKYSA